MKLSITYVVGQLTLGGAERQLFYLVRELVAAGHAITVITMHPDHGDYFEGPLRAAGANVEGVSLRLSRPQRVFKMASILRRIKPDLVHSWTFHTNLYAAAGGRLAGVPVAVGSERSTESSSRQALGNLYGLQLRGLNAIVTNNQMAASHLRARRPSLHVEIVANGVEAPNLDRFAELRSQTRAAWGLDARAVIVGASGALVPEKGFTYLIDAVAPLMKNDPNLYLVIVGEGTGRADLQNAARHSAPHGRVLFPGVMPALDPAYAAFDVFCLTVGRRSREGMPNVIMEASCAGLPVVASDVAGAPELVIDGTTGYLVAPQDVPALRSKIELLLNDPDLRRRLGAAGRLLMIERYGIGRMSAEMLNLYRSFVKERPRSVTP